MISSHGQHIANATSKMAYKTCSKEPRVGGLKYCQTPRSVNNRATLRYLQLPYGTWIANAIGGELHVGRQSEDPT